MSEIDFTKRNAKCEMCELHKGAKTVCVWGEGPRPTKVMVVGLGTGTVEDKVGRPFQGRAGKELETMLTSINLPRNQIYISNAVKCIPPKNNPSAKQIRLCYAYLHEEIKQADPDLVIAAGHVAWHSLQGKKSTESLEKLVGKVFRLRKFQKVNGYHKSIKLMAALHPSAVLRNPNNRKKFISSWIAVRKYLDGKLLNLNDLGKYDYIYNPREAIRCLDQLRQIGHFSFDYETGFDLNTIDVAWMKSIHKKAMDKFKPGLRWEFPGFFLKSISFSAAPHTAFVIPLNYPVAVEASRWYWKPEVQEILLQEIRSLMEDPNIFKCAHNINFDRHSGERAVGYKLRGFLHDTILMHFILWDYKPHNLEDIAWEHTKIGGYSKEVDDLGGIENVHGEPLFRKNAVDSDITERLLHKFPPLVQKDKSWGVYTDLLVPGLDALYQLEETGFPVDLDRWKVLSARSDQLYKDKRQIICDHQLAKRTARDLDTTFNPNSDDHLRHIFFNILDYPVIKKTETTKEPSVDMEVLNWLDVEHQAPLARDILMYKKVDKIKTTYIDGMRILVTPEDKVHARYNLHIARTGRTSSDSPNLQNIPKSWDDRPYIQEIIRELDVREVFIAPPGFVLAEYDFNQHELRCAAMASHDTVLTDAYRAEPNKDIHSITASGLCVGRYPEWDTYEKFVAAKKASLDTLVDKIRRDAKVINFGIIYGKTVRGLERDLKCDNVTAKVYFDAFWTKYAGLKAWKTREEMNIELRGYAISLFGQKRRFPFAKDWQAKKEGINHIIQNTASQLMLLALVNLNKLFDKYNFKTRACAEVHDAILFLIPENEYEQMRQLIPQVMTHPDVDFLHVPLQVNGKFGDRWSDLKGA